MPLQPWPQKKVLSVSELTAHLKSIIEAQPELTNVWVEGEVSNFRLAFSGHIYFTLKDQFACLKVVLFRSRAGQAARLLRDGLKVVVRGYVTVYERDGVYQLYAQEVIPSGVGWDYLALEQLKKKLAAEGLFDAARKRKLPPFPRCIGIVTSPYGAVIRDMLNIIKRRWPGIKIIIAPVSVQGDRAAEEIIAGIRALNCLSEVEVIIIGRGGGSAEELAVFNQEELVRAVASSRVPVVSAVGHETDVTLCDFAADLRAPTPSAAAELVVPVRSEYLERVEELARRLTRAVESCLHQRWEKLRLLTGSKLFQQPDDFLLGRWRQQVDNLAARLLQAFRLYLTARERELAVLAGRLEAVSPLATLARGYSICRRVADGHVLLTAGETAAGEKVEVLLSEGRLLCTVDEIDSGNDR